MKKPLIGMTLLCLLTCGCAVPIPGLSPTASEQAQQEIKTTTDVKLSQSNYRILKTNLTGSDWGISLLGIFPIVSPDYTKAIEKLYRKAGVTVGRPQAVVNLLQQHTSPHFILFSIPRITFRADLVEFQPNCGGCF